MTTPLGVCRGGSRPRACTRGHPGPCPSPSGHRCQVTGEVLSGAGELVVLCKGDGVPGWERCCEPREYLALREDSRQTSTRAPGPAGRGRVCAGRSSLPRGLAPRQSPLHCAYPPPAPSGALTPSLRPCDGLPFPCPRLPSPAPLLDPHDALASSGLFSWPTGPPPAAM